MRRMKNLPAIIVFSVLTLLLVAAVISTIVLAFFSNSKKATVSLAFADSVTVDIEGINTSNQWLVATEAAPTTYIINDATLAAPAFKNINVKVTSGATSTTPVTVRVFAIVYTTNSTIASIPAATGATTVSTTLYTDQEKALISSVPKNSSGTAYKYSAICVTREFTSNQSSFTSMISDFYPLTKTLSSANMGAKMQGIVVITAKNRSTTSGQTISVTDWNNVLNYTTAGIKWA